MLDMKFVRENPDIVKQNLKNKFQEEKLPLVDEVIELDAKSRAAKQEADELRANRNKISKQIGALMAQGKKEEAEEVKKEVTKNSERLAELEALEKAVFKFVIEIDGSFPFGIRLLLVECSVRPGSVPVPQEGQSVAWVRPSDLDRLPVCPADRELLPYVFA